jgi:hypothetical protein
MKARRINGDEMDAFSRNVRHAMRWRRGALKRIKRAFRKRQRREERLATRAGF